MIGNAAIVPHLILHDRALVKENLPAIVGVLPKGRSTSHAIGLHQDIGEEVVIGTGRSTVEILGLPSIFGWGVDAMVLRVFIALDDCGDDFFPAIAATGCTDFPKGGIGHLLKILARGAKFRVVENGFTLD
jgi:hypothetical protein